VLIDPSFAFRILLKIPSDFIEIFLNDGSAGGVHETHGIT